ncbi:MAG: NAD(P)H-dependent oxidoreductase [Burkholderiaceae bacterium]|nr:NAD(P)H-dependent oxidoreductase [Burkholderiaceae bacterium]MDO9088971.1 NAD(P)H-dependent oxidoreductase [Burkholderiaceae bacterium]
MSIRIAVFVGSLRKDSLNRKLALALAKMAPAEVKLELVQIGDLPLYNQDDDANQADAVKRMKAEVKAATGLIFVTPEYNRSISGVLKNALDHGSRPAGQSSWAGKPAGVMGVSSGAVGTLVAQQHLRNIVTGLDMPTLTKPDLFIQNKDGLFAADGSIGLDDSRKVIQAWLDAYLAWVRKLSA